jgi:uncharacterized protein (TIGR03435 family)
MLLPGHVRKLTFFAVVCTAVFLTPTTGVAQAASTAQPQAETLTFDVASVRQTQESSRQSSNVPLGAGNVYTPSHGILSAKGFPVITYLLFAYKLSDYQRAAIASTVPEWVVNDRYSIEARTDHVDVTKDELRLMMRSLLAERFKLAVHYEKREARVFALVIAKPGALGPKLRPHPDGATCSSGHESTTADGKTVELPIQPVKGGFPVVCNGILGLPASAEDRISFGASNVPMSLIASVLSSWGDLGQPVVDQTGLTGTYDFVMDYAPDPQPSDETVDDSDGPRFQEALKEQLGLKLEAQRAAVPFLVVDHVERPNAN